jgi:hypothetical protein
MINKNENKFKGYFKDYRNFNYFSTISKLTEKIKILEKKIEDLEIKNNRHEK